jgi:hypothetical protein
MALMIFLLFVMAINIEAATPGRSYGSEKDGIIVCPQWYTECYVLHETIACSLFSKFFGFYHQFNLVQGSVLASSGFNPIPIAVAEDRTVVHCLLISVHPLILKLLVDHMGQKRMRLSSTVPNGIRSAMSPITPCLAFSFLSTVHTLLSLMLVQYPLLHEI